jgi:CubicO group peptidase (beta-lactamase class C family)
MTPHRIAPDRTSTTGMVMKLARLLAPTVLLLVGACAPAVTPPPAAPPAPVPGLEAAVDGIFERWDSELTPGCVVAADLAGERVLSRAYGMADLEHGIPNRPETILEAGSVSKQFAAAAVVLLALDGALSLDDDVRRHVPEVPDYGAPITIRHLLNHTSGLRDWGAVAALSGWGRSDRTHDHAHVLDIIGRQTALNYPPGDAYSYTNSGYNLLAVIVERVSGTSFADFSRDRIFEPLGLRAPSGATTTSGWCPAARPPTPRGATASASTSRSSTCTATAACSPPWAIYCAGTGHWRAASWADRGSWS